MARKESPDTIRYYRIELPDSEKVYSYSAEKLQQKLNDLLMGQRIQGLYVCLFGYHNSLHSRTNIIDMSYLGGGGVLLVFEKTTLELTIQAVGMIQYRYFPSSLVQIFELTDYVPDNLWDYYFSLADHDITFDFKNALVNSVSVKGTNCWAFHQPDYAELTAEKAAERSDLPREIDISTESCLLRFLADNNEYYWVVMDASPAKPEWQRKQGGDCYGFGTGFRTKGPTFRTEPQVFGGLAESTGRV